MRRLLFIAIAIILCNAAEAQHIKFAEQSHNFGKINEDDGPVSHDFNFTNTGDKPLLIKQVITGCGCTSAKWTVKEYKPGASGTVRITYNPKNRKAKNINIVSEVFTNAESPITLKISGSVFTEKQNAISYFDPSKGSRSQATAKEPKDDYETILKRVRERYFVRQSAKDMESRSSNLMKTMNADGTWDQYDYKCFFRTNWEPVEHLTNLRSMAIAYTCPTSPLCGNKVLYKSIEQGLRAWIKNKPKSYNWWYNEISAPQTMGDILAIMDGGADKLPTAVVKGITDLMAQCDATKYTGANKMDIAYHQILRGCVLKDKNVVETNINEFFQPLSITDGEGIKKDYSFQQHHAQLYIGGYGTVMVKNIAKTAGLFTGTRFALPDAKRELFSNFVRNTYLNTFRSRYMDFSVLGRSVSSRGNLDHGFSSDLFQQLKEADPQHAKEYDDVAYRFSHNDAAYHRTDTTQMFYCSDYMLHNSPLFDVSVRAVSNRTCRSESGNGENAYGTYLSEGATCIRVTGNEYNDIFPVWEWDKVPGTTTPAGEVKNIYEWGAPGVAEFVGGVSNGKQGVMAYHMNDYGLEARKGYFIFNNEMVCLGAGITSSNGKEINTCVNQCILSGTVENNLDNPNNTSNTKGLIWHNKIAYIFPNACNINFKSGIQTGSWSKINFNQSNSKVSKSVFNLSISHGRNPKDASYAYIVAPGLQSISEAKAYDTRNIQIISNTKSVQAVGNNKLNQLQAIFYAPGKVKFKGKTFTAKQPCVVIIDRANTNNPAIKICDPTQKSNLTASDISVR